MHDDMSREEEEEKAPSTLAHPPAALLFIYNTWLLHAPPL